MASIAIEDLLVILTDYFDSNIPVDSLKISSEIFGGDHEKAVGMLKSLTGKEKIKMELTDTSKCELTKEGEQCKQNGSPEYLIYKFFQENYLEGVQVTKNDLIKAIGPSAEFGLKIALKNSWISFKGPEQIILLSIPDQYIDTCQEQLKMISNSSMNEKELSNMLNKAFPKEQDILKILKRRKLIQIKKIKYFLITKAEKFSLNIQKEATDLTSELLINDNWADTYFKPYNFFANGKRNSIGSTHPLMQMQKKFKNILTSMGFEEMFTDRWVESSFWNFDSLFMPQQHPARDAQDTFFIKDPQFAQKNTYNDNYSPYIENVRTVHEEGNYGSLGWRSDWSLDESLKNVLRTHTTGCSTQFLYRICKDYEKTGKFIPRRVFSIDRVFRNESLDATHLAEFHQVEGMVIQEGMSLSSLMGVMKAFYTKLGIPQIKFKPTFNPYTEPSMEIYGFHKALNKWIEVGNSGVFRPEVTETMNIPPNVTVIAWGLSLERPTMIQYGINNIRDLFGAKSYLDLPIQL